MQISVVWQTPESRKCIMWIAFLVTSLCKKLVVKHSKSDLITVQQ